MIQPPTKPRPGRPAKFGARLERMQVLLTTEQRASADREAQARGVSVSQVVRDWIEAGRRRKSPAGKADP